MKATQPLVNEHRAVLVALTILDQVVEAIAAQDEPALAHLEQLLEFFREFVDRCHHGKEEDVLFPELMRRGVMREGGPIGVMLSEHASGREHLRAIGAGLQQLRQGDAGAAPAIREHARAYRELLAQHIRKENEVLFPVADRVLPDDVGARLIEEFEQIEHNRVGNGKHEGYHALLHDLQHRYRVT